MKRNAWVLLSVLTAATVSTSYAHESSVGNSANHLSFNQSVTEEGTRDWLYKTNDPINSAVRGFVLNDLRARIASGERCLDNGLISLCIAPDTTDEQLINILERLPSDGNIYGYDVEARWSRTATNSSTGGSGNPIVLTYSFPADGLSIPGDSGETAGTNVLNQRLTQQFGSADAWKQKFAECFARWSQLTGITYRYEPNDDEAAFPNASGQLNVRGDIRIVAKNIDGQWNVLAYNYYPSVGDMVLDSSENWASSGNNYRFFRNTIMHEHGHGLGQNHVYPVNGSKLMEPTLSTNFDGPQDDDIRGANLNYGDPEESNNTAATASDLGALTSTGVTFDSLSSHSSTDVDYFKFSVPANSSIKVTVKPLGSTYNVGESSSSTPSVNTKAINNLVIAVFNSNGTTVLTTQDTSAAGVDEVLNSYALPAAAGTYYARISNASGAVSGVQRYNLNIALTASAPAVTVAITSPSNNAFVKGAVNLAGTITNGGASPSYTWKHGSTTLKTATGSSPSYSWNTSSAGEGAQTITLTSGSASASVNVIVDNTLPSITLNSPQADTVLEGTLSVNGTINDANPDTYTVKVDGTTKASGAGASVSASIDTGSLSQGSHTLLIEATDKAGNKGTQSVTFVVDRSNPTVSIISPSNNATVSGNININASISDANADTWRVLVNGSEIASGAGAAVSENWTVPAGLGSYTIRVEAADKAGNTGSASVVVNGAATSLVFTGTVRLGSWDGSAVAINSLPVSITVDGNTQTVNLVGAGNTGIFTLELPVSGNHTITVKPQGYLSETLTVTSQGLDLTRTFDGPSGGGLIAGDVNGDNNVDDFDLAAVIFDFGGAPSGNNGSTDVNGSGSVDDFDLAAVIFGFGKTGN